MSVPERCAKFRLSIVGVCGVFVGTASVTFVWTIRSVRSSSASLASISDTPLVVSKLSAKFLDVQKRRRTKTRELLKAQKKIQLLLEEISVLQSEEVEVQEKARFISEREDEVLDAFENVESRGGGVEHVDSSLDVIIPNSDTALDEWLQFVGPDFFGTAEAAEASSLGS